MIFIFIHFWKMLYLVHLLSMIEKEKELKKILESTANPNSNFSPRKYVKSKCDGPKRSTVQQTTNIKEK